MIEVYGNASSRAFRVFWLLEELQLEYVQRDVSFRDGEHLRDEFMRLNPASKVPVLIDGGEVYHETSMMLWMLADKYADGSALELPDDDKRYKILQWLFFGADELEQGIWTAARHKFVLPKEKRIQAAIHWGHEEFAKALDYLSVMLGEREFLVGGQFSIADIQISQILMWAVSQQSLDLRHDNLWDYLKRAKSREAFIATVKKYRKKD